MSEAAHAAAAAPAPAGKKSKVKIIAIVGIIVAVQCALAFMFLPGGDAKADSKKEKAAKMAETGEEHGSKSGEAREVDLGQFNLTTFNPNSNTTLVIDFHLYGTVSMEREEAEAKGAEAKKEGEKKAEGGKAGEEPDNSKFGKLLKRSKHRFREQVIVIIRNAEMGDLADPGLGLIKRQILAKTNSLLGEPLLKEVIFSDFAVVEQ
jgi:flagellar basal body-associated protein FliL